MTKPDFSDFYRFLASLGIILISLAFFIPWLFLHETFDIQITATEISQLTTDAQALIGIRQKYALIILQNIGWFSIVIGSLGLILFLAGIALWWSKKQTILDEKDNLELKKLRHDVAQLTPLEIAEKVIRESTDIPENAPEQQAEVDRRLQSVNQYFATERAVIEKLKHCFGDDSLLTNRRIGRFEIDAILLTKGPRRRDVVIEIKTASVETPSRARVLNIANQISHILEIYVGETKRKSIGVGILVLNSPDGYYDAEIIQEYKRLALGYQKRIDGIVIRVLTMQELTDLTCAKFRPLIDFDLDENIE